MRGGCTPRGDCFFLYAARLESHRRKSLPLVVNELRMRYLIIRISDKATSLDIPLLFTYCLWSFFITEQIGG